MNTKQLWAKWICAVLVVFQCMAFVPMGTGFAASDDIPVGTPQLYNFEDELDLKAQIIQDETFITDLSLLAHMLGFGWCGGTKSPYVGGDMDFSYQVDPVTGKEVFVLKANYDPNDPYAEGYWADKRLEMELSNVRLYVDGESLRFGSAQVMDLQPIRAMESVLQNWGNAEDTERIEFSMATTEGWSRTDNFSFSEKVGIKNKYKFKTPIMGTETEMSFEFTANQGWSEMNSGSTTITQKKTYVATIPAMSQRTIEIMALKKEADIPYSANMYLEYDLTLKGFLRWSGNARMDHPEDRPFVEVTFGGKNGLNAQEDILSQYIHRDLAGDKDWDWQWMKDTFGERKVQQTLSRICKTPYGGTITGKFTGVGGTHFNTVAGLSLPLDQTEYATRTKRSTNGLSAINLDGNMFVNTVSVLPKAMVDVTDVQFLVTSFKVPQSQMIATANSEEHYYGDNGASLAIDGNVDTIWHSLWYESLNEPYAITLELGETSYINKLTYLPRQDSASNGGDHGRITAYTIYTSLDGETFTAVDSGVWANSYDEKTAAFAPIKAAFIRLEVNEGVGDWASAAEINVFGVRSE